MVDRLAGARVRSHLSGIPPVVGTTLIVILLRRGQPGLLACWAAVLIMLSPNMGLMRISNWGLALEQSGRPAESIAHFPEAARLEPDRLENHLLLAEALARRGMSARRPPSSRRPSDSTRGTAR